MTIPSRQQPPLYIALFIYKNKKGLCIYIGATPEAPIRSHSALIILNTNLSNLTRSTSGRLLPKGRKNLFNAQPIRSICEIRVRK